MKINSPYIPIIINHLMNNMSLQLPGNSNTLELPKGSTLESLYQINNQSIWYLIWILKKERFWSDLVQEVIEEPFTIDRRYYLHGQIGNIVIMKNNKKHSVCRGWYKNGQIWWENYWKDHNLNDVSRSWCENGELHDEHQWKNGEYINVFDINE